MKSEFESTTKKLEANISRKTFLKRTSLGMLSLSPIVNLINTGCKKDTNKNVNDKNEDKMKVRSISYNVFNGCIGYQGVGGRSLPDDKKYDLLRKARELGQVPKRIAMQLLLYSPDIISFCEGPDKETLAKMATILDMNYVFFPTSKYHGDYPGGILTKYEIVSSENKPFVDPKEADPENLFTRHWGKAVIKLPSGKNITIHSLHTWPFKKTSEDKDIRNKEIDEVLKSIHFDKDNNTESVLLQGDLNLTPDSSLYDKLINGGLVDSFAKVGDKSGFAATSQATFKRKDFILGIGPVTDDFVKSRSLYEGDFRLNTADERGFAFSDHIPVLTDFKD